MLEKKTCEDGKEELNTMAKKSPSQINTFIKIENISLYVVSALSLKIVVNKKSTEVQAKRASTIISVYRAHSKILLP